MTAARQQSAPLVHGMSVVYLYVSDMERSVSFYREILGIPLEYDPDDPHWAEATLGGVRFALHLASDEMRPQTPGTVRINFAVDDVDAAAEHVRSLGVRVGEVFREPYGSFVEIFDPDGYAIELFRGSGDDRP